jgi:uncharacterized Zn-binding protein involved in type VI secretion
LSNDVNAVPAQNAADNHSPAAGLSPTAAAPDQAAPPSQPAAPPLAPSQGSLGDQLGSAGLLGNTGSSFAAVSKGWHDLVSPTPQPPTSSVPAVQTAQNAAKTIRLVQQTIGAVMSTLALPKEMLDIGFANLTAPLAAVYPSMPAATLTTMYLGTPHAHSHPPSLIPPAPPVPLPSMGPVTLGTFVRVLINNLPAARVKDLGYAFTCGGLAPIFQIKTGSSNVFIGGHRAARMGDICVACVKGESRSVDAGAVMAAVGTAAGVAGKALQVAGMVAGLASIVADAAEAAVDDDAAMASAKALAASMGAAQMAADAVAMALSQTMGTDPGIPPSVGALLVGHPTVLIGGFPMIDIPNPVDVLLSKLSRFTAKSPAAEEPEEQTANCGCPR